jgi:hypothetical protein
MLPLPLLNTGHPPENPTTAAGKFPDLAGFFNFKRRQRQKKKKKKKKLLDYSGELLAVETFLGFVEIASNWWRLV